MRHSQGELPPANYPSPSDPPRQTTYTIDLSKPYPKGWRYIGCVCEFANECQMTDEDIQKGVKCKAYWAYQKKKGHN